MSGARSWATERAPIDQGIDPDEWRTETDPEERQRCESDSADGGVCQRVLVNGQCHGTRHAP